MNVPVIYASQAGVLLDSDVIHGGGTDQTEALQAILDRAAEGAGLCLVMDGAALVRGLRVYSRTTIRCLNEACGFYLMDNANHALVTNADWDLRSIRNRAITLEGGTYNHNCAHQEHHVPFPDCPEAMRAVFDVFEGNRPVFAMEFYGVGNVLIRDVVIRDQRTFAMLMANWEHVTVERVRIELPGRMYAQNQDGLHFWGPGRFLTIRDIAGRSGDDFIALAPDEHDLESSITDVLIDGVFLDDADQGVRLLSRKNGLLDRVTIRNVSGTYRSFGFQIQPFFTDGYGNLGHILIENVSLSQTEPVYDYTNPYLFRIGGSAQSLVFKNISHIRPADDRPLFDIGWPFFRDDAEGPADGAPFLRSIAIEGLRIVEDAPGGEYIRVRGPVGRLSVSRVDVDRPAGTAPEGRLVRMMAGGRVDCAVFRDLDIRALASLVEPDGAAETAIGERFESHVLK